MASFLPFMDAPTRCSSLCLSDLLLQVADRICVSIWEEEEAEMDEVEDMMQVVA